MVIQVQNLSKQYVIGGNTRQEGLRHVIETFLRRRAPQAEATPSLGKTFWALEDINFEIQQGEIIGVIGHNGAGKSTLLKIMSRITEPTRGRVVIRGKMSSLLEVGTGFHPELSGRENVFLNGTILGMSRKEIQRKFDEIVAFSEVEKFIDTPVKRYSSGMYVRLAFAVAAYLDCEILVVDEVLAVGDVKFQEKCLGTMRQVQKTGRTVILVSHNMSTITSLCQKTMLLDHGRLVEMGNTSSIVLKYYQQGGGSPSCVDFEKGNRIVGSNRVQLLRASVLNENEELATEVEIDEPWMIEIKVRTFGLSGNALVPNFHFYNAFGVLAFIVHGMTCSIDSEGDYSIRCLIPENFMNEGVYFVGVAISSYDPVEIHFYENNALAINIRDGIEKVITRPRYTNSIPGAVRPLLNWEVKKDKTI